VSFDQLTWSRARAEYALMLRVEGLNFAAIGRRMGVSRVRSRQLVHRGAVQFARAAYRTRFRLEVEVIR
jgi:hypothetical protein